MATFEVKLPDIGEGVNEGEIVRWLVKEGDVVKHDQPLVEVMTDKATVEIPCSSEGKVVKILAKEGQVVKVGGALLSMDGAGASAGASSGGQNGSASSGNGKAPGQGLTPQPSPTPQQSPAPQQAAQAVPQNQTKQTPPAPPVQAQGGVDAYPVNPPPAGANVLATPATRRYAREMGVDLNSVHGTGPSGRITRDDVGRFGGGPASGMPTGGTSINPTMGTGAVAAAAPAWAPPAFKPMIPQAGEERKPFRGIRKKIAENLVRSKQIIPHFTHADEADVTELVAWRTQMKVVAEAKGIKLTYLPFIMKALVATCREFPNFNASIDDAASEIVIKHTYNVGFAADTPEGLLVPVVKNVESKSILEIAHDIVVLAEKARAGKLASDDMKHGTITITNIGSVGGLYATPIINHPEVAIMGVYSIQKKPVVINDEIKIRDMMNVTATCDHRLIDGAMAARFLKKFIPRLEKPQSLLLEMI